MLFYEMHMVKVSDTRKELGNRHICSSCGIKYYDLHRPVPTCPKCHANPLEGKSYQPPKQSPLIVKKPTPKKRPSRTAAPDDIITDEDRIPDSDDDDDFGQVILNDDDFDQEDIG